MLENPTTLVSPIIGLVQLRPGEKFNSKHPNSYKYESIYIGGNNSRIALQEMTKKYPENVNYQIRLVAVYVGLTEDLVLEASSKPLISYVHSMTTQDKVLILAARCNCNSVPASAIVTSVPYPCNGDCLHDDLSHRGGANIRMAVRPC